MPTAPATAFRASHTSSDFEVIDPIEIVEQVRHSVDRGRVDTHARPFIISRSFRRFATTREKPASIKD
jgi:hypothetical protein